MKQKIDKGGYQLISGKGAAIAGSQPPTRRGCQLCLLFKIPREIDQETLALLQIYLTASCQTQLDQISITNQSKNAKLKALTKLSYWNTIQLDSIHITY